MAISYCLKHWNKSYHLRTVSTKIIKTSTFRLKLKKLTPALLFSMLRFVEENVNLQQVLSEKIRSVLSSLILGVSWHLNINSR